MSDRAPDPSTARALWDESADGYEDFISGGLDYYRTDFHGPALARVCGDVSGKDVLDLGCGQGWFTRVLAAAGARVTGVDWSPRMIAHAIAHEDEAPVGARYRVLDAADVATCFAPRSLDLITACMSLMDMPDPGRVLAAARALVRPGGRVIASVSHPATDTPHRRWARDADGAKRALEIDGYFDATTTIMEWNMARLRRPFRTVQYRTTLEAWSRMIDAAGLGIARLHEPRPDAETIARRPELSDAARVPYVLIFELRVTAP
jgi:SAM-dependent methyltransferase